MAAGGRTAEEAFQVLVRASQRENRKLRDICADIVERASQRHGADRAASPVANGGSPVPSSPAAGA